MITNNIRRHLMDVYFDAHEEAHYAMDCVLVAGYQLRDEAGTPYVVERVAPGSAIRPILLEGVTHYAVSVVVTTVLTGSVTK